MEVYRLRNGDTVSKIHVIGHKICETNFREETMLNKKNIKVLLILHK